MSLEDAVNSGIRAHDQMHAPCEAEIARLRARLDKAEAVVRAVEKLVEVLIAYQERA